MCEKICVYPGTFDPITNGHFDIIERGSKLFDKIYITLSKNSSKNFLFSVEERKQMIEEVTKKLNNVEVVICDELTVNFAEKLGAKCLLRGLRAITDFEYELQMASMNREINDKIDTIFMMTKTEYSYLSSSIVKEVALYGGVISSLVHPHVQRALENKIKNKSK